MALDRFQTCGREGVVRLGVRGEGGCSLPLADVLQSQLYFAWVNRQLCCCVTVAPLRWLHFRFLRDSEYYGYYLFQVIWRSGGTRG